MAGTPIVNAQQRAAQLGQIREEFARNPGIIRKIAAGLTEIPHKAWETGEMPSTPEAMRYSLNTLGGLYGTGGAARMAGVGGLSGEGAGMGLPVGRQSVGNWAVKPSYGHPGRGVAFIDQTTPSGLLMQYETKRLPSGELKADLAFREQMPEGFDTYSGNPAPSMREGLERLNDVFASAEHFVSRVKPKALEFSSGGPELRKLYDRVAPKMAERLGGKFESRGFGEYRITFPEAAKYATPKPKPPPPMTPRQRFAQGVPEGVSLSSHIESWASSYGIPRDTALRAVSNARRAYGDRVTLDQIKDGLLEAQYQAAQRRGMPQQAPEDLGDDVIMPEGFIDPTYAQRGSP